MNEILKFFIYVINFMQNQKKSIEKGTGFTNFGLSLHYS